MSARWLGWALAGAALLGAPGCSSEEEQACPAVFIPAATVVVVDAGGAVVGDAHVTYSQNGHEPQEGMCPLKPAPPCAKWWVGGGAGTYLVRATSADGTLSAEQTVTVTGNACDQPFTQQLTLTLK